MHRRTISKASDELLKALNICTPPLGKMEQVSPQQVSEHLKKKGISNSTGLTRKQSNVCEEESHIRNIIAQRKAISPVSLSDPETSTSPIYPNKNRLTQETERVSFNTSTTAFSVNEENSINRILYILEASTSNGKQFQSIKKAVAELLEKSPEPHFTLVLDVNKGVKGVFYVEMLTGYFHRILGTDDLPIIIAPRRVKSYYLFDSQHEIFVNSTSEKFDAVMLK